MNRNHLTEQLHQKDRTDHLPERRQGPNINSSITKSRKIPITRRSNGLQPRINWEPLVEGGRGYSEAVQHQHHQKTGPEERKT